MTGSLVHVTSAGIAADGSTFTVVRWEVVDDAEGYNVYRRPAAGPVSWGPPLNGTTTVRVPSSGAELLAIVSPGTAAWSVLVNGLSAVAAGTTPGTVLSPVDPVVVFDRGLTPAERTFVQAGAQADLTMGRIAGLAFIDTTVTADETYLYELRAVRNGAESVAGTSGDVWAGHFTLPPAPSGVTAQAGDGRVLVSWNRPPAAATFLVQRATSAGGPYARVNARPVTHDLTTDLDGQPLPATPGFIDAAAWDADGAPATHPVDGVAVDGPHNGITYHYRVAARDALDRTGPWSAPVAALPIRALPPMAPDEVQVTPTTSADGMVVRWRTVIRNVEGHRFTDHDVPDSTQTNLIHRAPAREQLEDLATLSSHLVTSLVSDPRDVTTPVQTWTDTDPALVPPYGTTPFYYRVLVRDQYGLVSAPSAVVGNRVPDTTPPGPTVIVDAVGRADHIHVEWRENPEPDVAGYRIYRGVCDFGRIYIPGTGHDPDKEPSDPTGRFTCDMVLVGEVPLGDARVMMHDDGVIWFDDSSVPANSPICYAYWIRAYDFADNLYPGDGHGCPAKKAEYTCAALREKTPPEPPVITNLKARNNAVLIEWVGAPEQDIRAFHVYRSDKENDPPQFVACVFTDGTTTTVPWHGIVPSCMVLPAMPDPLASRGSYLDTAVEPHREYWYRVAGVDWLGNESTSGNLTAIPASSTFTYTSDLPGTPTVLPPTPPPPGGCGLEVTWEPPFDPATLRGYVVSRSSPGAPPRQVSPILTVTSFTDPTARRGIDYRYTVQAVDAAGTLSEPSLPVLHRY
ncbi:fibronectin type III domain-containing protein [Phytohabitans aurantiacus]|uniref:Fibronectin type-III domain-containing protein n=1 Tax=Phytohabitans aurantiacus TaxID=3016789 RepID=A0ABQ5R9M4_9ACTN|nr:fibronectin type III domain-containing protein [Phytohabitans aurantiacus]GLI03375.1 hypothetical protein Pa4123_86530 [Phytohabitans aurantiacus]